MVRINIFFPAAFLLLLLCHLKSSAQTLQSDSLVFRQDLQFDNTTEGAAFFAENNVTATLQLLYCTDNAHADLAAIEKFSEKVTRTTDELKATLPKIKKREKQIQQLYNTVHSAFLTKYQNEIDFHHLVESGTYNCVTATLLYSVILDQLGIPYVIKETPQHVFLVSYPNEEQILLESTDPDKGYMFFNDTYKNLFVQNLRKGKIISEQEFRSSAINTLFDKYYYTDANINQRQLISIHYTNNALMHLEKENYRECLEQIKKAYFINPSAKNLSLLFTSALLVLQNKSYESQEEIQDLLFLSRFIDKGISANDIRDEFSRITYLYLVNSSRPAEYDRIYARFDSAITNPELHNEIDFLYNYEKGRNNMIKAQYALAFPFVKRAFELKENNTDAQINLISLLGSLLAKGKDSRLLLAEMDSLGGSHPVILDNNNFVQTYKICYLATIESTYQEGRATEGEALVSRFESFDAEHKDVVTDSNAIGRAYSEAVVYYFKKGNRSKAREYLMKGVALAPDSQELRTRQIMLNY